MNKRGWAKPYRAAWLAAVLAFVILLLWLVFSRAYTPVNIEDVKSAVNEANPPEQTIKERTDPLQSNVEGLELSLSSSDGSLQMRVWADQARKDGGRYQITSGALQFLTESNSTVLLQVEDAVYTESEGVARVAGSIIGRITGSEQYFEARHVEWDITGSELHAGTVTFRAPSFKVSGEEMFINLLTGEIRFTGPVTANI